uniref:NADH-ubiquinone oxidoreductase chain 2 n=1 Tax=Lebbeus groenlandicus TaxID=397956 RepID=A0A649UDR7_9EUCA|nr:NADH dehydrogenase subunit 2 [Lebbeus groenlandicus]QGI24755.1 NADH dehydrogenase subunit 2 [Lebbeus groenlandicus]
MFFLNPARILFLTTLTLGALLAASSTSWLTAWFGLELNLLSFIPLIASTSNIYSSESALKYFLIQALGSALILASAPGILLLKNLTLTPIILALLIKMGAAPFHFWFPSVMQGIQWNQALILMTIQKMAPLFVLTYALSSGSMMPYFIVKMSSILSSIVGSLGGLNQTLLRKIMAYSSINHLAWMLAALSFQKSLLTHYFAVYVIVVASVTFIFMSYQIFHFNQMFQIDNSNTLVKVGLFSTLFSMGGLPPFLGFIPKLMVVQGLALTGQTLWLAFLLLTAVVTLIFYVRLLLMGMVLTAVKPRPTLTKKDYLPLLILTALNLTPLIAPLSIFMPF